MSKISPVEAEIKLASNFNKFHSLVIKILYSRKNFSKKWQKDAGSIVYNDLINATKHIDRAKMIYPDTEEALKEKRKELTEAITSLDAIISSISFEITSPSDLNFGVSKRDRIPIEIVDMINYYCSLKSSLLKWKKHLKMMKKKGTNESFNLPLHTLNFVVYQDMNNGRLIIHDLVNNKPHVYEKGTYRISDDTDEIYIDDPEDDLGNKIIFKSEDIHKLNSKN